MTIYTVVASTPLDSFISQVQSLIALGYQVQGGVAVTLTEPSKDLWYVQALVKEDTTSG